MRNYGDYNIRYRAKDPNDSHLYRNKTPGGTVSERSRSRSLYRRNGHARRSRSEESQTRYLKGSNVYRNFSPGSGFKDRSRSRSYRRNKNRAEMDEVKTKLAEVVHKGDCYKHKIAVEMYNLRR